MRLIIVLFATVLAGCPVTQIDWYSSTDEIRIAPDREGLGVSSKTTIDDKSRHPTIDVQRSFATKEGKTYTIATHRNAYVDSQKDPTPWAFEWVNLLTHENGKDVITPWPNGDWELHLEYSDATLRPPIDAKFNLWTFWYIPIIHGPPN